MRPRTGLRIRPIDVLRRCLRKLRIPVPVIASNSTCPNEQRQKPTIWVFGDLRTSYDQSLSSPITAVLESAAANPSQKENVVNSNSGGLYSGEHGDGDAVQRSDLAAE